MNKGLKGIMYLGMLAALMLVAVEPALAQGGLDRMTSPIKSQLPAVADVLSIIAYIAGIGFGIKAALKLKEHNESKGQVPLSAPITLFIVAGVLLALPTMLSIASEAVVGTGNTKVNASGTGMRSIN